MKGTPNSIVHGVQVGAVWGPHVGLDEVDLLFLQIVHGSTGRVRWRAVLLKCPSVMTTSCLDVKQQALSQDNFTIV